MTFRGESWLSGCLCFSANPLRLQKDSSSDKHPVPQCPCILVLGGRGGAEFIPVFFSCKAPVGLTVVMSEYQASYQHNAPRVYAACCPLGMELCLIQTMSLELRCDCLVLGVRKLRLTPFSGVSLPALHTGTTSTLSVLILWLLKLRQSLPPHPQHSMTMF